MNSNNVIFWDRKFVIYFHISFQRCALIEGCWNRSGEECRSGVNNENDDCITLIESTKPRNSKPVGAKDEDLFPTTTYDVILPLNWRHELILNGLVGGSETAGTLTFPSIATIVCRCCCYLSLTVVVVVVVVIAAAIWIIN